MRMSDVADSIEQLPSRFRGPGPDPIRARFRMEIGKVTRDVVVDRDTCRVEPAEGNPDVVIATDTATWRAINDGKLSGIEAFGRRRITIRGSIEKSLHFEPLFERPDAGAMRYSIERIPVSNSKMSVLQAGDEEAPPLVLIHGLGATKASWLTVVPQLARHHRVIAVDMPGFGASSKPIGRYDARWFAAYVDGLLDRLGHERAFLAGNSMGGRISMETAMQYPDRIEAIACLCPAAAFSRRPALALVRVLRPELGIVAGFLPRERIKASLRQLFANPSCVEDEWYDAAVDDFLKVWRDPRGRIAFFAALRNIYLDEPEGDTGFWRRLARMDAPALYIYGTRDVLITHHFSKKILRTLPNADVRVWRDCGHVPQIEFPDRTADALVDFFAASSSDVTATAAAR